MWTWEERDMHGHGYRRVGRKLSILHNRRFGTPSVAAGCAELTGYGGALEEARLALPRLLSGGQRWRAGHAGRTGLR